MKFKNMSLMALFCLLITNSSFGDIIFRRATVEDVSSIMELARGFDDDDKHRLVTYPDEIAKEEYTKGIEQGIYLAIDLDQNENKTLVAFLKLYAITDDSTLSAILVDEMGCSGPEKMKLSEGFILPPEDQRNLSSYRDEFNLSKSDESLKHFERSTDQRFIYYGGAYTLKGYRGKRINTRLTHFAVKFVSESEPSLRKDKLLEEGVNQIVFLYGQVLANTESKGMILEFADSLRELGITLAPKILHLGYQATKPEISFVDGQKKYEFFDKNAGLGNLAIYSLALGQLK